MRLHIGAAHAQREGIHEDMEQGGSEEGEGRRSAGRGGGRREGGVSPLLTPIVGVIPGTAQKQTRRRDKVVALIKTVRQQLATRGLGA